MTDSATPTRQIELRRRHGESLWATVDAADYDAVVAAGPWRAHVQGRTTYAKRDIRRADGRRTTQSMHAFLVSGAECVDHRNGDGLDNTRTNLRPATTAENAWNSCYRTNNSSGYHGVNLHRGKWQARVRFAGRRIHVGHFDTPEAAARARDAKALELHGAFAAFNFA